MQETRVIINHRDNEVWQILKGTIRLPRILRGHWDRSQKYTLRNFALLIMFQFYVEWTSREQAQWLSKRSVQILPVAMLQLPQ